MKKYVVLALALAILCGVSLSARAESIGFELGTLYYNCNENTAKNGSGSFLAITLPVDNMTTIGFYKESLGFALKDDKAVAALGTTVNIDASVEALQVTREIAKGFYAGLHIGEVDLSAYIAGAFSWTDTVPMGDVYIKWNIISGGDKVKTDLNATLGYRALYITPVDPDGAGGLDFVKPVDDLGGMWVTVSFGIKF